MTNKKNLIKKIQENCLDGKTSVNSAVNSINSIIGGITQVVFNNGSRFKIYNHNDDYSLEFKGISNKALDRNYGLATLAYNTAQQNGSIYPGQVHVSRQISTKHHRQGFSSLLNKYLNTGK